MTKQVNLPPIPDKRYFSIGEVSQLCALKPHVLRYWESEFAVIKPIKRRGSRRYYQTKDVELIRFIRHLLYEKGYTINGAKKALQQKTEVSAQQTANASCDKTTLQSVIVELEDLLADLQAAQA